MIGIAANHLFSYPCEQFSPKRLILHSGIEKMIYNYRVIFSDLGMARLTPFSAPA